MAIGKQVIPDIPHPGRCAASVDFLADFCRCPAVAFRICLLMRTRRAFRQFRPAKAFFRKAIKGQGSGPRTVTLDGYAASHRAVREMKADGELPAETKLRSSKYLNNLIEQDHRGVKQRIGPMLGFKWFRTAAITIAGIELLLRIHKGQFNLGRLRLRDRRAPAVWNAVLAAP
ncbi:MAG TPA: DDE-type integrase/transposase/recombinase [Acetobacteraceae bacterium]|nr:DDE-type integrase/transposase/recombinase [Acetobacteraceae bacterium]